MKTFRFACLFFLFAFGANGQELYGKYLDHEQGLLSKECYDIICDKKGYLLISTQYGPVKYDGEKCTPICMNLPIEERVIYDFEKAPDGTIYLLNSKQQILKLKGNKAIHIGPKKLPYDFADYGFIKLHWAKSGLYILSAQRYLKYSFRSKKIHTFYNYNRPQNSYFKYVFDSRREFPFLKYIQDITTYFNDQIVEIEYPETHQRLDSQKTITVQSREDALTLGKTTYILINTVLYRKKDGYVTPLNFKRVLFMEQFYNRIWLCSYDGLLELDLNGNLIRHYFKGQLVAGVSPLRSGGLAVSFNKHGVFICSNSNNRIYKDITASSAVQIPPYNLIGTSNGSIYQYKDQHFCKLAKIDSLGYAEKVGVANAIWEINAYENYLLVTSTSGMYCYDRNFRLIRHVTNPRCYYFGLIINNNNFYFTQRISLRKTTWQKWKSQTYDQYHYVSKKIFLKDIRCYYRLNDSIVLIGTDNGLIHFNVKTDRLKRSPFFNQEYAVRALKRTASGEVVVFSRYHGIYIFDGTKLVRHIPSPSVSVMSGLVYKNHLIVQGNDGIFMRCLDHWRSGEWIKIFNGETQSVFALENSLLISYNNDLIITHLADYKKEQIPVILNTVELGETRVKTLPAKIAPNRSISLDFDILHYEADKLDLFYRLNGSTSIRQSVKGTQINFDALKSGQYILLVYPVINGEIHFDNPKKYHFTIEKTFWESTAFYIITGFLLVSIIISIVLIIHLRRRKRKSERSELESKLNEYKLLAVKAQVNPHFLSNGFAAIQALILKEDNDLAAQYLAKFSFLMRKILYYSETQFITVKQELELVDAYLELELLRFRHRFNVRKEMNLSESQLSEFRFPSLLLQPILENAIWHGLKFQENDPELNISFSFNPAGQLIVRISDNGPGFNTANQSEEHLSKGNKLIRERIDALNLQFQKAVAFMEVSSSSSGTTITFLFSPEVYQSQQL
ncbi:histidine kinase [Fluviicola sp.]|uniref:sensor histidine kinase n=1 Tax=Fluviicola sp. TaxID=1917219 RepID=UPI0031D6C3AF